ncbi:MAG: DUF58 domain-containing protein [Opitutales bacterium]
MTPSDILKKVRRLEIRTRHLVTEAVTGAYHSSFKGRGMDFEEVREYCIGDDIRTIDWNVSAKMDRPYVKVYREERELTLMLLVDLSASGIFGSSEQSKRERAAEIASVLAFSATFNNDKVGLLLYTGRVEHYLPPKKGRRHILRLIRDILFFEPRETRTDHRAALDYLNGIQRRKAVVFMISDFLENPGPNDQPPDPNRQFKEATAHALALTNRRHDLVCILLSDPRETELPNVGLITLEDAETGEHIELDTGNARTRKNYAEQARQRRQSFDATLRKQGIDWIECSTEGPYLPALRTLFARRARRL